MKNLGGQILKSKCIRALEFSTHNFFILRQENINFMRKKAEIDRIGSIAFWVLAFLAFLQIAFAPFTNTIIDQNKITTDQINMSGNLIIKDGVFFVNATSGNVGIGTTSPTGTLSINSSNALGSLRVFNTTGAEHLFVNGTTGNVGIGTTAPEAKLEVNGSIRLNTTIAKPTCDSSQRGTLWFTQGGAGVKDTLEVCAKDATDVYAWRTLY
jgi:hypothetical protein